MAWLFEMQCSSLWKGLKMKIVMRGRHANRASLTAVSIASWITSPSAANCSGIGQANTVPYESPRSLEVSVGDQGWTVVFLILLISSTTSSRLSVLYCALLLDFLVKKLGNTFSFPYTTQLTECVSKYSTVLGMSKMLFTPEQTTHTGVFESSCRSADISNAATNCFRPFDLSTDNKNETKHTLISAPVYSSYSSGCENTDTRGMSNSHSGCHCCSANFFLENKQEKIKLQ